MSKNSYLVILIISFFTVGCEQAKDFKYYIKNKTTNELTVYIDYSISAKGNRKADTLTIPSGDKQLAYSHAGLGGFYTGTIEKIWFSNKNTLNQILRNRTQGEVNKHFFRLNSWKITYNGDNEEHYRFTVKEKYFEMEWNKLNLARELLDEL